MPRKDDLKALIDQHQRRLQKLKEQQARYGISAPPEVLNEIEDIEAEIQHLQTELEAWVDSPEEEKVSDSGIPPYSTIKSNVDPQAHPESIPESGDTITANITGDISGQVAVGKDISQDQNGCAQFWKRIFSSGSS